MYLLKLIIIFSFINICNAQNIIRDFDTNKPIPYVNISVKNTNKGFYANSKGVFDIKTISKKNEFTIKAPISVGDTLVFSVLGYKSKEIIYKNSNQFKNIKLIKKIEVLDEVELKRHKKYKEIELGIKKNKNGSNTLGTIKMAVYINNPFNRDKGTITELIYKKIKFKFKSIKYDFYEQGIHFKNDKNKINNEVAVKIQLYAVNSSTKLPDLDKPLINKTIILKLEKKFRKFKYDISSFGITLPKNGVFLTLEVLGIFNELGEIETNPRGNIVVFGTNTPREKSEIITYGKYKERPWSKNKSNLLFSLKVKYPID